MVGSSSVLGNRRLKATGKAVIPMSSISAKLLRWYDANRRELPWRVAPGEDVDPYRVWVSEIMLQQTTVATITSYFGNFVARWPTIEKLAEASLDEILHAWQGLGYYSRAHNLHKCAREVVANWGGTFPRDEAYLRSLTGIGPYTAAAISAIAYGHKATPVDGNVERVMARLHAVETPLPKAKLEIRHLAESLTPEQRAGDFAQAMMDLGALVCRPKAPNCSACPLKTTCLGRKGGDAARFPVRRPKKPRPTRYGTLFWLVREDGAVSVRRRPEKGLLGGMMEFPSTPWSEVRSVPSIAADHAPVNADWLPLDGTVEHVFTHFRLVLEICTASVAKACPENVQWCRPSDFDGLALPTVMKKVARHMAAIRAGHES